jgi:hypothetical protein
MAVVSIGFGLEFAAKLVKFIDNCSVLIDNFAFSLAFHTKKYSEHPIINRQLSIIHEKVVPLQPLTGGAP